MSTHPNVLLIAVVTPNGTSRKTMRAILEEAGVGEDDRDIALPGGKAAGKPEPNVPKPLSLHHLVMEKDYDESWQISAKEGDLLFFDLVTYGYGEALSWSELEVKKHLLDEWAVGICARHNCTYEIRVSANYW
jgi:hypothetical protein